MGHVLTVIKDSQVLDEIVENSLGKAIWDMVKDKLHSNATELSNNNGICIARAHRQRPCPTHGRADFRSGPWLRPTRLKT